LPSLFFTLSVPDIKQLFEHNHRSRPVRRPESPASGRPSPLIIIMQSARFGFDPNQSAELD
jgi:hypothetical protein